jgi:hypothetical protein
MTWQLIGCALALALLTFPAVAQIWQPITGPIGAEVARLRVEVPHRETFQVWGTVPIPPGVQYDSSSPFTIVDQLGRPRVTQAEAVRFYPDGTVAVFELIASVDRLELTPGTFVEFSVTDRAQPWGGLPHVKPAAAAMAMTPGTAFVRAVDLEGQVYIAQLGRSFLAPTVRVFRWGPCKATARVHSWLAADIDQDAGPPAARLYPFAGSATAYWTAVDGSDALELDLQFANAAGVPLETLWLETLELVIPSSWAAESLTPDPYFGPERIEGGTTVVPLARRQGDDSLHAMRWGQRHAWRLVVYPRGQGIEAREILHKKGWGLAVAGESSAGTELLSWSSVGILPQGAPAPDLTAIAGEDDRKVEAWARAREAMREGTTLEFTGDIAPRLGAFFHSYGSPYGGMTGGSHIWPFGAAAYAWADRRPGEGPRSEGMLYLETLATMNLDRQRGLLMGGDGLPISANAILPKQASSRPKWRRYRSPGNPTWDSKAREAMRWGRDFDWIVGDPFGQDAIAHPATDRAFESGRVPSWYWNAELDEPGPIWSWGSIDAQHGIRFLWPLQTLVELTNDMLSRELIQGEAQVARMERHVYQESSLFKLLEDAKSNPGIGSSSAGRGDAHTFNLWAYAFSIASPTGREAWRLELETVLDALLKVQTPFGIWTIATAGKVVSVEPMASKYVVAQSIESSFISHAVNGLAGALARGRDPELASRADAALIAHAAGVVSWGWQGNGSFFRAAVAPIDSPSSLFVDGPPVVDHVDATTIVDPLAVGLALSTGATRASILAGFRGLLGADSEANEKGLAQILSHSKAAEVLSRAAAIGIFQKLSK